MTVEASRPTGGRVSRRSRRDTARHPSPDVAGPVRLTVDDVHVTGRHGPMLDLPGLTFGSGECVLIAGDPGEGHTALALVATGRLTPHTGTVTLTTADGRSTTTPAELRAVTAVVDLPEVSEPDDVLTVGTVVAEELALGHRPSGARATRDWLADHDMGDRLGTRVGELDGPRRTALLTSLAAGRPGVRLLVLTLPDRHGGDPSGWWAIAQAFAARGFGVLVQCTRASASHLGVPVAGTRGDAAGRAAHVEVTRTAPGVAPPADDVTTRELPAVGAPPEGPPDAPADAPPGATDAPPGSTPGSATDDPLPGEEQPS
ncbi:hypothetical protein SAMN05216467_1380 [Cellulomonas sp. KH9]|nr:hypothetical protein SAMN05216467_1380 [Cellulomonas sp. KH9]